MILPERIREVLARATCLYDKQDIEKALDGMAQEMAAVLSYANPIMLCVVIGGIIPLGNLLPRLDFPLEVDYIHVTRYGNQIKPRDVVWKVKPTIDLKDRTVVVVDDILDGGITLGEIISYCKQQGAKNVFSAVLVDKCHARLPDGHTRADFSGLTVSNHYVFGYGMDYRGYLRNAPGIYQVDARDEVS